MSTDAVPATGSATAEGSVDGPVDTGPGGLHVWFAACGGIGIWMAHLIAVASLARIACTGSGVATWWNYGITAVAAGLTVFAMVLSEGLRRRGRAGGDGNQAMSVGQCRQEEKLRWIGAFPGLSDKQWRENFSSRPYVKGDSKFEDYGPAYRHGVDSYGRSKGRSFDDAEPELTRDWERVRGNSNLSWEKAKDASHDAWQRR